MAAVHLFSTVVLVGIGQNWGDCNTLDNNLRVVTLLLRVLPAILLHVRPAARLLLTPHSGADVCT